MPVDIKSATNLILWNRRTLAIGGMWPLDSSFVHFYISFTYFIVHMALALSELYKVFGDVQLIMENLLETSIQVLIIFKMVVIRHSSSLKDVLLNIGESINDINGRDDTEKELYLAYNSIGWSWFKGLYSCALITTFTYYFGPLQNLAIAAINNQTVPYVLPFKTHIFFDIQDGRIYAIMYIWQLPLLYYYCCETILVCFLCTLVVNVTGEMSVLAHRIRHIGSPSEFSNNADNIAMAFPDIIKKHLKIMWQTSAIDGVFNLLLLEDLVVVTGLFGLVMFNFFSNTGTLYDKLFLLNYCLILLGLILVYCITGDYIIRESENIHEAYYECPWYKMEPKYQKNFIIFLARSQKPLQLTAGRFYVFSLPRFSEILKTSMAYVTMLGTVV